MAAYECIEPGSVFGKLQFLRDAPAQSGVQRRGVFRCSCGATVESRISHIKGGKTTSCGCHRKEIAAAMNYTHGAARRDGHAPEYGCWAEMKKRCDNPRSHAYTDYGGRGIRICERWHEFSNFLADMGPRPSPKHSLDRYPDCNGNYEPSNCRWATATEQVNNRRNTEFVEYRGRTQAMADWARELGFKYWSLRNRIVNLGWSVEKAFNTPAVVGRNQFD